MKRIEMKDVVMAAVTGYIQEHQYAPSIREICEITGIQSTNTVYRKIQELINEGKLETDAGYGSPRALRLAGYKLVKEDTA